MTTPPRVLIVGDVHGHLDRLRDRLVEARLLSAHGDWAGGPSTLVFLGDFFNRGPHGVGTVDLAMRLEVQAPGQGGRVLTLLGNHDVLILAARRFGDRAAGGPGGTFLADWRMNGGKERDLERLTDAHAAWLARRPALLRLGGTLLAHADATFYTRYGGTVEEVNAAFAQLLSGEDARAWDRLLGEFSERDAFLGADGARRLSGFLAGFGAERLVHGHTPIARVTGQAPECVTRAHTYAGGRAVNVDPGLYLGGPGLVYGLGGRG